MKAFLHWMLILPPLAAFSQQQPQLEFTDKAFSPSQAIHRELFTVHQELYGSKSDSPSDSVCVFNLSTIKFTIAADGTISRIVPSVGLPSRLWEKLRRAIKKTEGRWVNHKGSDIDCILPLIILPAMLCEDERPFEMLTSGAQMLKYRGVYTKFPDTDFYKYNTDMVEGVLISPLYLQNTKVH